MHLIQVSIGYGHPQTCWGYSIVLFKMYDIANLLVSQYKAIGWEFFGIHNHKSWLLKVLIESPDCFWLKVILDNLNLAW